MNDLLTLEIIDMNESGQGVAKNSNTVYFVNKAVIGDLVEAEIVLTKKNYKVANAVNLIKASELRKPEFNDILDMPYGLSLQALKYTHQLTYKENKVYKTIAKIANIDITKKNQIIGLEAETRYRNKGVFPIRDDNGEIKIGAFERASHNIIEVLDNVAMPQTYAFILEEVKNLAQKYKLSAYNELRHKGALKFISVRSNNIGEHLIILHLNDDELADDNKQLALTDDLLKRLNKHDINVIGIVKNVNSQKTNFAGGGKLSTLYGKSYIYNSIEETTFKLGVNSFFQVSTEGVQKLYNEVIRMANLVEFESLWDVYCGVGSIGIYLAKKLSLQKPASKIRLKGLEYVEEAITFAKENAELNDIKNTHFKAGKAEDVLPLWQKKYSTPDLIIVDPPRKGVDKKALDAIIKTSVKHIIYVSCKVSTLARDLKILSDAGYKCLEFTPVDIFPMSMHSECVVLLQMK